MTMVKGNEECWDSATEDIMGMISPQFHEVGCDGGVCTFLDFGGWAKMVVRRVCLHEGRS